MRTVFIVFFTIFIKVISHTHVALLSLRCLYILLNKRKECLYKIIKSTLEIIKNAILIAGGGIVHLKEYTVYKGESLIYVSGLYRNALSILECMVIPNMKREPEDSLFCYLVRQKNKNLQVHQYIRNFVNMKYKVHQ